jgi:hypothetical protein
MLEYSKTEWILRASEKGAHFGEGDLLAAVQRLQKTAQGEPPRGEHYAG